MIEMAINRGLALATADDRVRDFERELHEKFLGGHWEMMWVEELAPISWSWDVIRDALDRATGILDIGRADDPNDRRTVHLVNPTLADIRRMSRSIQVAVQLVLPGERGEAHRHTQNAMRFVTDSSGDMYTTVNGEKMVMSPGDLVLTPNWAWHDHTNASPGPAFWLDILDVHLTIDMGAHFKDTWTDGPVQPVTRGDGYSTEHLRPVRPRVVASDVGAIPYAYKWADTSSVLQSMHDEGDIDPHEGAVVEFAHPVSGGSTFASMQCRMQLIPPGTTTRPLRRTGVTFYHAFRGQGVTTIGTGEQAENRRTPSRDRGQTSLAWGTRDCLMVPSWRWQSHTNTGDEPAYLFSVTDSPALSKLGWYREDRG